MSEPPTVPRASDNLADAMAAALAAIRKASQEVYEARDEAIRWAAQAKAARTSRARRISAELDALCGVDRTRLPVPYAQGGGRMDYPARESAGRSRQ